jgi:Domain of unknown function DUF29
VSHGTLSTFSYFTLASPIFAGGLLIAHLLKWHYQSSLRSRSWSATILVQRMDIAELLEDNPGLQPYLEEALGKAYRKGVELAISETGLPPRLFPVELHTLAEILNDRFYPGEDSDRLSGERSF